MQKPDLKTIREEISSAEARLEQLDHERAQLSRRIAELNSQLSWFFFTAPVPARDARKMGCYLLTETTSRSSLDVATFQSLVREDGVDDRIATYGDVIVDQCHNVPSVSFERVMREVKARYAIGLTAAPRRRDGHHPILLFGLGAVRYTINPKSQAATRPFDHKLVIRQTVFRLSGDQADSGSQEICRQLVADEKRNRLILDDARLDTLFLAMPVSSPGGVLSSDTAVDCTVPTKRKPMSA